MVLTSKHGTSSLNVDFVKVHLNTGTFENVMLFVKTDSRELESKWHYLSPENLVK